MSCMKCELRDAPKTYEACNEETGLSWFFDVGVAESIIARFQVKTAPIPTDMLMAIVRFNDVEAKHIDHVDMSRPIIIGMLPSDPKPPSAIVLTDGDKDFYILPMDGSHRAARALRDGLRIRGYILSEDQTMACLAAVEDRQQDTFAIKQSAYIKSMLLALGLAK